MKSIFIVTETIIETIGHGSNCESKKLSFITIEDAQKFINEVCEYRKPKITELQIFIAEK